MLLNSKGSASYGFVVVFFMLFLICFIYICLTFDKNVFNNQSDDEINNSLKETNNSLEEVNNNYEKELIDASELYISEYYSDLKEEETIIVKMSTLRAYEYVALNECQGYVVVKRENNENQITPFLSCGDSISEGYQKIYE